MSSPLRFRRLLDGPVAAAHWPTGVQLQPLEDTDPMALHRLLVESYRNGFGSVPPCEEWWSALTADAEFDPALLFVVVDAARQPIALAQCWSSGYLKDLVVDADWRGQGIGEALLLTVFAAFAARGVPHVDLKVEAANAPAPRLYRRLGMTEAPL